MAHPCLTWLSISIHLRHLCVIYRRFRTLFSSGWLWHCLILESEHAVSTQSEREVWKKTEIGDFVILNSWTLSNFAIDLNPTSRTTASYSPHSMQAAMPDTIDSNLNGVVLEPLVIILPPEDTAFFSEAKTTSKKGKQSKRGKSESAATEIRLCVANCRHGGICTSVQCHLCQTWAHYDCVGENEADIVGTWACRTWRALPTTVTGVLRIVTTLQTTITDLCTLVGQQQQEIRGLRYVVVAESGRQLADLVTMVAEQR